MREVCVTKSRRRPLPPGYRWVRVRSYRHWRSGRVIHARDYGKEFFIFPVRSRRAG